SVPVAPDRKSSWIVPPGAIGFNPVQWHSPVALPFVPRGGKGCAWHASPSVQTGAIIGCGWEGLQAKGWRAADGGARTGDAGRPAMAGWRVFFNQGSFDAYQGKVCGRAVPVGAGGRLCAGGAGDRGGGSGRGGRDRAGGS